MLRPLHSLWIDILVLRLLSAPRPQQHPVWFVLDELASLQKLPQLHTAITENRKSRNPIILGFQGKAQLEVSLADVNSFASAGHIAGDQGCVAVTLAFLSHARFMST
jgi:type IV secretory pathway TraG/TraD family ATPase VirD4